MRGTNDGSGVFTDMRSSSLSSMTGESMGDIGGRGRRKAGYSGSSIGERSPVRRANKSHVFRESTLLGV